MLHQNLFSSETFFRLSKISFWRQLMLIQYFRICRVRWKLKSLLIDLFCIGTRQAQHWISHEFCVCLKQEVRIRVCLICTVQSEQKLLIFFSPVLKASRYLFCELFNDFTPETVWCSFKWLETRLRSSSPTHTHSHITLEINMLWNKAI